MHIDKNKFLQLKQLDFDKDKTANQKGTKAAGSIFEQGFGGKVNDNNDTMPKEQRIILGYLKELKEELSNKQQIDLPKDDLKKTVSELFKALEDSNKITDEQAKSINEYLSNRNPSADLIFVLEQMVQMVEMKIN